MEERFLTQAGQTYGPFSLINCVYIDELKITLKELIHIPSGAQIMHLENDDPENVFCLSFKTLPSSSNGVAHILEHTVLCGSRKFPVKDPFYGMSRRSLNTFMNALTGSDFTCYPAASQVEKDFYNLLEVYIDAVFHPILNELSFLQEGCRLEFLKPDDPNSELEYRGIVYNEMKGALNSVEGRVWHLMMESLVPDLPYSYQSGGDPKEIPSLTYRDLINFHDNYYHPSRCLFFFYGNFPLKKHLDFIHTHALEHATPLSPIDGIGHQKRFKEPVRKQGFYPLNETEKLEHKYIHSIGFLTTFLLNQQELFALIVLDSILMDTDASTLKKEILKKNLCVHVDCYLDTEMTEIPIVFTFKDCAANPEPLEKALLDALKKITKEGIPHHLVEAAIHQLELGRTEIGEDHSPFGLTLFMRSALAKQHGCAPEHALTLHSVFQEILEKGKDPYYFVPLIEKYFLHNSHRVTLTLAPDTNLTGKEIEEEKQRLAAIKKQLTEAEKSAILSQTKALKLYQEKIEHQKLECLPRVTLDDVPKEVRHLPLHVEKEKKLEVFHHDGFTNHLVYVDLILDLPHLEEKELFELQLFLYLWTEVGVGNRSYEKNLEYMHAYTGGIGAHTSLHLQASDPNCFSPSIQLRGKALARNASKLFSLMRETLLSPRFDERKRIAEQIKKLAASVQNRFNRNAVRYASQLALSGFCVAIHIYQHFYGLTFYENLQELSKQLSSNLPAFLKRLKTLQEKILLCGKAHLVLSCDQPLFQSIKSSDFFGLTELPLQPLTPFNPKAFDLKIPKSQASPISSPVSFIAQGFKTAHYGTIDAPALQIATYLFENKVLHHRIREQGGAYSVGATYNAICGNFHFYSYRDPHIARTIRTFSHAIEEIGAGAFDEEDLEAAKLGVIQAVDTPISPGSKAITAYDRLREGKTKIMRQEFRDLLLSIGKKEIQTAIEKNLIPSNSVTVAFAGKKILDKELPLISEQEISLHPLNF